MLRPGSEFAAMDFPECTRKRCLLLYWRVQLRNGLLMEKKIPSEIDLSRPIDAIDIFRP